MEQHLNSKEKAQQLVNKIWDIDTCFGDIGLHEAIECALIVVDEIISTDMLIDEDTWVEKPSYLEYWKEVRKEIYNLKNK